MQEQSRNVPEGLRNWAEQIGLLPGGQDAYGVYRKADVAGTAALLVAVTVAALIFTWAPRTLPFPVPILGAILMAAYLYERRPTWSLSLRLVGVAVAFLVLASVPTIGLAAAMSAGVAYHLHRRRPRALSGLTCIGEWDGGDEPSTPFIVSAVDMASLVRQIEQHIIDLAGVEPEAPVTVAADPDEGQTESVQLAEFAAGIDPDEELPLRLELVADGNQDGFADVVIARLPEE